MTHDSTRQRNGGKKNRGPFGVLWPGERLRPVLVATALLATVFVAPTRASGPEPELARIKTHVTTLASPEFGGRRGAVAEKSRTYLIDEFKRLGLDPLFDGSFLQDIPDREPGMLMGRNVGAKLVGSDPRLRDHWVIVAAHFDHLGVRDGVLFPGADDNASAVAMMLEVARCLVANPEKPRRSVMFIGFDLEEQRAVRGSRYFAEHSPVPLDRVALFVTADMIGRSLAGVGTDFVFVLGTERWPPFRDWIGEAGRGKPLPRRDAGRRPLLLLDRSDYGPFRSSKIPFLFFSTGEEPVLPHAERRARNPRLCQGPGDQPGHVRRDPPRDPGRRAPRLARAARQRHGRGAVTTGRAADAPRALGRAEDRPDAFLFHGPGGSGHSTASSSGAGSSRASAPA